MEKTVLIVEDHVVVRHSLRDWLEVEFPRFRFCLAETGEDALQQVEQQSFDLILMDITLPGISGIETTRRLKERGVSAPVVILTIHDSQVFRKDAEGAGAAAYVAKWQGSSKLLPTLHGLLSEQEHRQTG